MNQKALQAKIDRHMEGVTPQRTKPVWKGPEEDGITFSLLSKFIVDRERFRLLVVEGLKPRDEWNKRLGYGNMWHCCEETFSRFPDGYAWSRLLYEHAEEQCRKYPYQQAEIDKWYNVCRVQFPLYVEYWKKHPEMIYKENLFSEKVFDVAYKLPSGRTVKLLGKWDSGDVVQQTSKPSGTFRIGEKGLWLQENKTKGDIDQIQLQRQLKWDLQTMMYVIALESDDKTWQMIRDKYPGKGRKPFPFVGVRYNVVRRPLSGGKGTIRPHQETKTKPAESMESFYKRLGGIIKEDPGYYFMRWNTEIDKEHIDKFKKRTLDPLLEQLCQWWDWIQLNPDDPFNAPQNFIEETDYGIHWQMPYGVYNPLLEGGSTDLDMCVETGNEVGLERTNNLFPELT